MIKVLLIDDEEIIREGLKKVIGWKELGCKIVGEAEDGSEGIKLIKSLQPDIVLTDIRMSGTDGFEMISKIKDLNRNCKIVILTGFRNFEYAQEAVRLGVFRLLLKPSKTQEITLAIQEAISEILVGRAKEDEYKSLKEKLKDLPETKEVPAEDDKDAGIEIKRPKYLISKAITYLKSNYSKDLNLKKVADELYISTWYLSKLLKKETGSTFIDILNTIRIEEAKRLLLDPRYKIYKIAEEVGFTDIPYFSRLFKKITGMTPIEYRNKIC